MAEIQKFECKETGCGENIFFNPDENVVSSLNESFSFGKKKKREERVVTAYLTCAKNHTHPYRVTKIYEI